MYLNDFIHLGEFAQVRHTHMNMALDDADELELTHERFGHVNESTLIEACRNRLVDGINLPRKWYASKRKGNRRICDICSKIKITRHSFNKAKENLVKKIGDLVSTDLVVFANCPSREGIKYVQTFTDHASKYVTAFGSKERMKHLQICNTT
jgi:hypothetical protein